MRFLAFGLVLVLSGCGLDNISVSFESTTTVQGSGVLAELTGDLGFTGFQGFDIGASQEFQNEGAKKEDIDSVRIVSFTLSVESPSGQDLSFLDSLTVYVETEGLPRVQIASGTSFPSGGTSVSVPVDAQVELKDYFTAPSTTVTTEATGNRPDEDTTVKATVVFDVDVDVGGFIF